MITRGAARGLFGLLFATSLAMAQDTAPPLDAPALVPPATEPGAAATTPSPRDSRPDTRPLLVIPGVTAPLPPKPAARTERPRTNAGQDPSGPALTPPADPRAELPSVRPAAPSGRNGSPRDVIPLTLEPITEDLPANPNPGQSPPPKPPRSTQPKPGESGRPSRETSVPRPAPSRGASTMLGRLIGPMGSPDGPARPDSSVTVEPRSDPAAEAAARRRMEKQIQQTLGDRVRSAEVRVSGKTVVIRAHAAHFWQRRSVRRGLEGLSLPAGYRARIEAVD